MRWNRCSTRLCLLTSLIPYYWLSIWLSIHCGNFTLHLTCLELTSEPSFVCTNWTMGWTVPLISGLLTNRDTHTCIHIHTYLHTYIHHTQACTLYEILQLHFLREVVTWIPITLRKPQFERTLRKTHACAYGIPHTLPSHPYQLPSRGAKMSEQSCATAWECIPRSLSTLTKSSIQYIHTTSDNKIPPVL